jgi:hypothetical protein
MNIIFFVLGLFIGWFFLPAPQIARDARDWLISKVPFLGTIAKPDVPTSDKTDTTPKA